MKMQSWQSIMRVSLGPSQDILLNNFPKKQILPQ